MQLGLGVGLSKSRRGVVSGDIPAVDDDPPGSFDGFETPPTVQTIADTVVVRGKTKAGFIGKFVVPLGDLIADRAYNVNFVADLSGLALSGAKAGFGFGMKDGNNFRLTLLQGDGSGVNATTVRGSPPNGWNKQIGHTTASGGAPTSGTQYEADVQLVTNAGGDAYTFSTSGDDQETWDAELEDQALTPFADVTEVEQFGIAGWFASDDAGEFSITVTWTEEEATETDPHWANVELLSGFEGADASTDFVDEGPDGRTLTSTNGAQVDTAQFKFGASSALFATGSFQRIEAADSADWQFDGQFTIECWRRGPLLSQFDYLLSHYGGGGFGWIMMTSAAVFRFDFSTDGGSAVHSISASDVIVADTWQHLAVDRDASNKLRAYVDGVMVASKTDATGTSFNTSNGFGIGGADEGHGVMTGWLDEVRITKGVARYASDGGFTPPAAAFPRG